MELSIQEVSRHPYVQELIEQNEMMAKEIPDFSRQSLNMKKKFLAKGSLVKEIESSEPPYMIENRLLFQEGVHNDLFYSYDDIKENFRQWENLSIFLAEHEDSSTAFVGVSKNVRLDDDKKAIYGDIETPNKSFALTLAYQIDNGLGKMGLSPTLDVNKEELADGKFVASSPWKLESQSAVLNPAVRTTVFNSKKQGGNGELGNETQKLKENEVAISKEDLNLLKTQAKEGQDLMKEQTSKEVDMLAAIEVALGRLAEDKITSRKEELSRLTGPERKILFGTYEWLGDELAPKNTEKLRLETFLNGNIVLRGNIPPEMKKYIEEARKRKAEMAKKKGDFDAEEEEEEMSRKPKASEKKMLNEEREELSERRSLDV